MFRKAVDSRKCEIVLLAVLVVGICIFSAKSANAGQIYATSSGHNFSSSWSVTKSSGNNYLVYGYNTAYIDEDFAWAYHESKSHYASVYNGNGWHHSREKSGGNIAKIEVTHYNAGETFIYQNNW